MPIIKLVTSDKKIFKVGYKILKCSEIVRNVVNLLDDKKKEAVIELETIDSDTMKLIIEWATYHKDEEIDPTKYVPKMNLRKSLAEIGKFDKVFLDSMDRATISPITRAAHYLGIHVLYNLLTLHIAGMLTRKTTPQLREMFGIKDGTAFDINEKIV